MSDLPTDAAERKKIPLFRGLFKYFPDALCEVARCSAIGNEQHNPGSPIHWDRAKSGDELDALLRHALDAGELDTDGQRHSTKVAWRALANLQKEIEAEQRINDDLILNDGLRAAAAEVATQDRVEADLLRAKEKAGLPLSREELYALEVAEQPTE